ncbi:uncharacterized protein LOC144606208 [Rhinoraja longicauda]
MGGRFRRAGVSRDEVPPRCCGPGKMALVCAGQSVMMHRGRDMGDWTKKAIVGSSVLRCGRGPGNNPGSTAAHVRQRSSGRSGTNGRRAPPGARSVGGAPSSCPPALGQCVQRRATAAKLEPLWLPLLPVRDSARWGPAKAGGRAVEFLSPILAVLPFYPTRLNSVTVCPARTRSKECPSLKPSEMGGRTEFLMTADCGPLLDTLSFPWSCHALTFQRVNDKCHSGLSIHMFQQLISSNTCAFLLDGSQYRYSGIKSLQQCRMYGYYKNGKSYFGENNAVPLPRGNNTIYYDILKVSPNATHSQIKSAYYKQSFIYHPDRNAGSEVAALRFTQINEAYSVLGSVSLKKKYDQGILTPADLHVDKKLSDKPRVSTVKQPQAESSEDTLNDGKSKFNFDEFYKAHYGKQLEMEQLLRLRRKQQRKNRENLERRWNLQKLMELTVTLMAIAGFVILFSSRSK